MAAAFRPRFRRGSAGGEARAENEGDPGYEADTEAGGGGDGTEGGGEAGGGGDGTEGGGGGDEWLAYELHEWALESRVMLQQLLTVDQVVHSWQGTTLMVHESLEEKVDSLVDEVEEAEEAKEATTRPIGPDDDLTAFEIGEWPQELRVELVERLVQARVSHILEESAGSGDPEEGDGHDGEDDEQRDEGDGQGGGCDLWVREADEQRVDLVIDDLLASVEEADMVELDGLEVNDLLSDLFVACDRLRRDPRDIEGLRGVAVNARRVAGVRTPFGFSAPNWRSLRNAAGELLAMVEGDDIDEDDRRELAHRLSDALRMLI